MPVRGGGRKSRHFRDESDQLLGFYGDHIERTTSIRNYGNPLHVPVVDTTTSTGAQGDDDDDDQQQQRHGFNIIDELKKVSPTKLFSNSTRSRKDTVDDSLSVVTFTSIEQQQQQQQYDSDNENVINNNNNHNNKSQSQSQRLFGPKKLTLKEKKQRAKKDRYKIHRVSYTAQNHIQIIFQMYGSAFPQVFQFCLGNIVWTLIVAILKHKNILDLTFHSSIGHSFMGLLVSFLTVSRSNISYNRFMEFRRHLAKSYWTCREIIQLATVYTYMKKTQGAIQWRSELGYKTIIMLRVTMDALLWSSTERLKWEEEYFQYKIPQDELYDSEKHEVSEHFFTFRSLSHGRRSNIDENFRAPISAAHVLRQHIMQHPEYLGGYKMPVNEYRDLILLVEKYLDAFHGFRLLIFTPYPFPLVQMTRAFLFFWVYSLPLVLLKEYRLESSLLIVMMVTFGFIGIEYVSMALDDPFGDDTNDIDEHGMALLVYEDIYMAIYRTDGPNSALQLRERVLERYKQGRELDCYRDDLKGYEFWEPYNPMTNPNHIHNDPLMGGGGPSSSQQPLMNQHQYQQQHPLPPPLVPTSMTTTQTQQHLPQQQQQQYPLQQYSNRPHHTAEEKKRDDDHDASHHDDDDDDDHDGYSHSSKDV